MDETTKEFAPNVMRALLDCGEDDDEPGDATGFKILSDKVVGQSRWSVISELIFTEPGQPEGEAWRTKYSSGATESQDEMPFQYAKTVKATRVRLVEKLVKVWQCADGKMTFAADPKP